MNYYLSTILFLLFLAVICHSPTAELVGTISVAETINEQGQNSPNLNSKNADEPAAAIPEYQHQNLFLQKPKTFRQDLRDLHAVMNADKIQKVLRNVANEELRVRELQGFLDGLPFKRAKYNRKVILSKLASDLDKSFSKYLDVLKKVQTKVEDIYESSPIDIRVLSPVRSCCSLKTVRDSGLSLQREYWQVARNSMAIFYIPGRFTFRISRSWVGVSRCLQLESRKHRAQFLATALPYPKYVVILLEHGNAFSNNQLEKAKSVAKLLLEGFSREDRVTVLAVSSNISSFCRGELLSASWETKRQLSAFIDSLRKQTKPTNHSVGFTEAFRLLKKISLTRSSKENDKVVYDSRKGGHAYIFYISRGLMNALTEAGDVISTLAMLNLKTSISVQINTFPVVDEGKAIMWEAQFLKDIAEQNFKKHLRRMPHSLQRALNKTKLRPPTGKMVVVSSSVSDTLTLNQVYELLKKPEIRLETSYRTRLAWSEPHLDPVAQPREGSLGGKGSLGAILCRSVISQSLPVWEHDQFVGIIGQDLSLEEFTSRLRYFSSQEPGSYVFMVDKEGMVVSHPKISDGVPWISPVDSVEEENIWEKISAKPNGSYNIFSAGLNKRLYHWVTLKNAPYILVFVSDPGKYDDYVEEVPTLEDNVKGGTVRDLTYHRLDLLLNQKITSHCFNLEQLSTTEYGSVYLAPGCFERPYRHLVTSGETKMAAMYWAHLMDHSNLIPNPGMKPGVKADIGALSGVVSAWKSDYTQSKYGGYVLRKYAATHRGVLVSYPAGVLNSEYDPTSRDWFQTAVRYPGWVVLSPPYLDPSGAGYIVTISHTVYEGKRAALHHPSDKVVAVMGMDVPLSFIYKLLLDTLPSCSKPGMRCILLEDRGYLVGHGSPDSRSQPPISDREPLEGHHLTHKEPLLAGDLLQHRFLVKKSVCKRLGDRTVQRIYRFNTSFVEVLKDKESIGCTRFQLAHVPRTNTFLVLLNRTCNNPTSTAFCPCSVTDRRCLNCYRSDATECECPCECPLTSPPWFDKACPPGAEDRILDRSFERERFVKSILPTCPVAQLPFRLLPLDPDSLAKIILRSGGSDSDEVLGAGLSGLPQCRSVACDQYSQGGERACLGLVGCQWCVREEDGKMALEQPFCTSIQTCFGGIRGRTPDGQTQYSDDYTAASTPMVGPFAGGIMVLFVLLVIGVYCYRHQVTRMMERRSGSASSGARIHLTGCEEVEEFQFDHNGSKPPPPGANTSQSSAGGVSHLLLASFERDIPRPVVPPPNYRHGPRTESSDHGYSTMTGNCDDSEQATTVGEPIKISTRAHPHTKPGGVAFAPKRVSAALIANSSDGAGTNTQLLIIKEQQQAVSKSPNSKQQLNTSLTSGENVELGAVNKRLSLDGGPAGVKNVDLSESPPPGQTQLSAADTSLAEPDGHTMTITAQVHAIDSQG